MRSRIFAEPDHERGRSNSRRRTGNRRDLSLGGFYSCAVDTGKSTRMPRTISASAKEVVAAIQSYIDEHLMDELGLTLLAQRAGYSTSYFSSLFTRSIGLGITDYIRRNRIEQAQELLIATNNKIGQICFEVGFNNLSHFNRSFKKMVGLSPAQYRHLDFTRK